MSADTSHLTFDWLRMLEHIFISVQLFFLVKMIKIAVFNVQYVPACKIEMFAQLLLNPFQAVTLNLM